MVFAVDNKCTSEIAFVNRLGERLECPICMSVFSEPWQTLCGHRFCRNCFESLFRLEKPQCPIDGEPISRDGSFRDKCCEREVLNLQCFCRYKERSCDWKGELRHLKAHEEICQYGDTQCAACGDTMERRHLQRHRENDCVNRAVACIYCCGEVRQSNMKDHLDVCLKFPINCILDCGKEDIPRGMMEEHVTTHCPKAEHLCPFSCHGCEFKGNTESLCQHIKSSYESHLHMINNSTHEINKKNKEMEEKVSHLENEKRALEQQLQNLTEELAAATQNTQTQDTKISILQKSVLKQKKEIENLLRGLKPSLTPSGANADVVSSQLEEIMTAIKRQETEVNNLQSELAHLKISAATPGGHDFRVSASSSRMCERRLDRMEHQLALLEIQLSELNSLLLL